jgi:hypothetical protein
MAIRQEGANVLLEFRLGSSGLFTGDIMKPPARRAPRKVRQTNK